MNFCSDFIVVKINQMGENVREENVSSGETTVRDSHPVSGLNQTSADSSGSGSSSSAKKPLLSPKSHNKISNERSMILHELNLTIGKLKGQVIAKIL